MNWFPFQETTAISRYAWTLDHRRLSELKIFYKIMQQRVLIAFTFAAALAGFLESQCSLAAETWAGMPARHAGVAILDLALDAQARANGQALTTAGFPMANATLVLQRNGREVARSTTNESGNFSIPGLNGGLYQMTAWSPTGNVARGAFRIWSYGTAPPSALQQARLVSSEAVVRGQTDAPGPLWRVATNPWMSAAAITALVATPIALSNDGS